MLGFEVGINEDEAVADLLKDALFEKITVTKDFNGINRVVTAIKETEGRLKWLQKTH